LSSKNHFTSVVVDTDYCKLLTCGVEKFLDQLLQMPAVKAPSKNGLRYHVAGEVLEYSDLQSLTGSRWLNDKVCIVRSLC